jgi:SRP40, C-terminal domain
MAVPQMNPLKGLENAGLPPKGNKKKKKQRELALLGDGQTKPEKDKAKKEKKSKKIKTGANAEAVKPKINRTEETSGPTNETENGSEPAAALPKSKKPKKPKNDPLRPEPAWLFPPDEENPVLNPKPKSKEEQEKELQDRLQAIKYLNHHAVAAPHKPPPPTLLLQLVGSFLDSYGFMSTGRIYTAEREARVKQIGWEDPVGTEMLNPKTPSLVQIYKHWLATGDSATEAAMRTTKVKDLNVGNNAVTVTVDETSEADATSSAGESSEASEDSDDDGSDVDMVPPKSIAKADTPKATFAKKAALQKDDSLPGSDSDSDDESIASPQVAPTSVPKPTVGGLVNKLKRKSPEVIVVDTKAESDSESSSSEPESPAKKTKVETVVAKTKKSASPRPASTLAKTSAKPLDNNSDDTSVMTTEEEDSEDGKAPKTKMATKPQPSVNGTAVPVKAVAAAKTNGKVDESSSSASSSSDSDASEGKSPIRSKSTVKSRSGKRKRSSSPQAVDAKSATKVSKKYSMPFQRVPVDTRVDPKLASNAYKPYDYAERAYKDLSVTKGKGFTKEKNKKKRGS